MLQEWELKESIIKSIAWDEPDRRTIFNFSTFKSDVESVTSKQEVFNCESFVQMLILKYYLILIHYPSTYFFDNIFSMLCVQA